jgi:hypothetical protein
LGDGDAEIGAAKAEAKIWMMAWTTDLVGILLMICHAGGGNRGAEAETEARLAFGVAINIGDAEAMIIGSEDSSSSD